MARPEEGPSDGCARAAVLLMSLGEEAAAQVLRHMGPAEVQRIGVAMTGLGSVSSTQVETALEKFAREATERGAGGRAADEYLRAVLVEALGEDRARGMLERILLGGRSRGLEALKWMDARSVHDLVRVEHPQVIAIVLACLDPGQAAEVLAQFPEAARADLVLRIAALEAIRPEAMHELDEVLELRLREGAVNRTAGIGGVEVAAGILDLVDSGVEGPLMERLRELDLDLGQRISERMFVFDNLAEVDEPGLQALLRECPTSRLALALRGAEERIRARVLACLPRRAAEALREDMDLLGPVRLGEVEAAQKELVMLARRLADEGLLELGRRGTPAQR